MPRSRGTPLVPWKHSEHSGTLSQAPEPVDACLRVSLEGLASVGQIDLVGLPGREQSPSGDGRSHPTSVVPGRVQRPQARVRWDRARGPRRHRGPRRVPGDRRALRSGHDLRARLAHGHRSLPHPGCTHRPRAQSDQAGVRRPSNPPGDRLDPRVGRSRWPRAHRARPAGLGQQGRAPRRRRRDRFGPRCAVGGTPVAGRWNRAAHRCAPRWAPPCYRQNRP
ncbi:unannotated protein [freshwater metagenome]|uniref:Unannotated protein n=1 Tax=freshwater metagenome TaxID=449393 RepID=A0A6J6ZVN7_9ZZZZ